MSLVSWLEIADNAVKIGLGALIAGAASFAVAKMSHSKELAREALRHEGDLAKERLRQDGEAQHEKLVHTMRQIREVARRIQIFSDTFFDYAYHCPVLGDARHVEEPRMQQRILANQSLSERDRDRVAERRAAARTKSTELATARMFLNLLGADDASNAVAGYADACERFWLASVSEDQFSAILYAERMQGVLTAKRVLDGKLQAIYPLTVDGLQGETEHGDASTAKRAVVQ